MKYFILPVSRPTDSVLVEAMYIAHGRDYCVKTASRKNSAPEISN